MVLSWHLPQETEKSHENRICIAGLWAKIWTWDVLNIKQKYPFTHDVRFFKLSMHNIHLLFEKCLYWWHPLVLCLFCLYVTLLSKWFFPCPHNIIYRPTTYFPKISNINISFLHIWHTRPIATRKQWPILHFTYHQWLQWVQHPLSTLLGPHQAC